MSKSNTAIEYRHSHVHGEAIVLRQNASTLLTVDRSQGVIYWVWVGGALIKRDLQSSEQWLCTQKGPTIDESLFAPPKTKKGRAKGKIASADKRTTQSPASPPLILTKEELEQLKMRAMLKSEEQIKREKEQSEKTSQKKAAAEARKKRMYALAAEGEKKAKKTDLELENEARDDAIRQMAKQKFNQQLDLVKRLKALAAQAEAFTIRDIQLKDKENFKMKDKEYNARMDELMEAQRTKDIKRQEEECTQKLQERIADREIILSQIKEREHLKLIDEEGREQEGMAMVALLKKYEKEDKEAYDKKLMEIKQMRKEILTANQKAVEARQSASQKEKDEIQAILDYQVMKDAEMKAREDEESARELAKKARQAELLAQQERAQSNQFEMDELRARRAAEQKERAARTKEKNDAIARRAETMKLKDELLRQATEKRARQAKEAARVQAENELALRYNMRIYEREAIEEEKKKQADKIHLAALKQQIADSEALHRRTREDKYGEGRHLQREAIAERARLEVIKEAMIKDMEKRGINPKYLTEIKRIDISKLQH